jgi:hypothetical protein
MRRMTDQELKEIKARFENRLHDSDCYGEFLNHHEPDVERLLDEVERQGQALLQIENWLVLIANSKYASRAEKEIYKISRKALEA